MAWCNCIQFSDLFDFSGYSDMAIGLGRMFGFYFLENFNFPYMSKTITEFWRRWHISLSSWFREYVYIPLGGNRKGLVRQLFNIMVVWMLTGLWHGANWNFVLWGVYYGVLLMIESCSCLNGWINFQIGSGIFTACFSWLLDGQFLHRRIFTSWENI